MKNKILFLILVNLISFSTYAKPRIVTSITPIASIVSMLTEDAVDIVAIDAAAGCPHHYHLRPSDKLKVSEAQMLIFIDDSFDSFAAKLSSNFEGKVVKVSSFDSIDFLVKDGQTNWHFWLDLNNVLALQKELSEILVREFPELQPIILKNKAKEKINSLLTLKKNTLKSVGELVVLNDSFEHFFKEADSNVIRLYKQESSSLKKLENLEHILEAKHRQCIIIDSSQDASTYKRFNKKVIQIESENWVVHENMQGSWDLFCTKYLKMINQLKSCR